METIKDNKEKPVLYREVTFWEAIHEDGLREIVYIRSKCEYPSGQPIPFRNAVKLAALRVSTKWDLMMASGRVWKLQEARRQAGRNENRRNRSACGTEERRFPGGS